MRELVPGELRLLPLGGLGQVGMNCLALQAPEGVLLIDCGTCFPEGDYGVDVIHPDFSWLHSAAKQRRLLGVFLTHGHEDHIGGLPYLLRRSNVPVWGPPHALAMARRRLREHDFDDASLKLIPTEVRKRYDIGPFTVESFRVTHSICDATALAIETGAGLVVHSGDFKLDPAPPDGELTDLDGLRALGSRGVRLLLSDSTNIDTVGHTLSEAEVAEALDAQIKTALERVVIGLFASNIQRLITIGRIARERRRRICLLGRSLITQVEVGLSLGRLDWPSDLRIAPEQAQSFPKDELLVLAGGTQAEPGSSLYRLARGEHHQLKLAPRDRVILSSRVIPGNEREVSRLHDDFLRLGVDLVNRHTDRQIHASGHAAREEQTELVRALRPEAFMPVHGTLHHLTRHAELARELGVEQRLVIENGNSALLTETSLERDVDFNAGSISVGYGGRALDAESLRRRRELGRAGVIFASLVVDDRLRTLAAPAVSARGLPGLDDEEPVLRRLGKDLERALKNLSKGNRERRASEVEGELARVLRRAAEDVCGSRPRVELHLIWR
ncbi:MAG: ribonuclease J [Myxococcales bacterium]|nr:ribonuclease J [Myxococcales bacterium]